MAKNKEKMKMNKSAKITTGTTILVLILIAAGGYFYFKSTQNYNDNLEDPQIAILTKACTDSGGIVSTASCCGAVSFFPNTCLIGACGCSQANSHNVEVCNCPGEMCFLPDEGCVLPN